MDNDLINSQGNGPIIRSTASDRVATFQANSNSIYNKYTPFTTYSIGPSQPFVYTKISDSTLSKNLTKYDSQAFPIGSTVRDLQRIGQYSVTGNGILYLGKQLLLQQQNSFNETRIYNPLSLLKATAKPGSLGLIDYPKRHLETSGGLLNFFKDALLSTIGFETKDAEKPRIEGTALGVDGIAYSNYAQSSGGARAGMLRLGTAKSSISMFESRWVTNPSQSGTNGGFLANLGSALIGKLKSMIPSTNPMGAFGGKESDTWQYRPEYKTGKDGVYYAFLADNSGFLTVNERASQLFYNDGTYASANAAGKSTVLLASNYHKYYPQKQDAKSTGIWYADKVKIANDEVGVNDGDGHRNNLKDLQTRMVTSIESFKDPTANQFRRSAERYSEVKDYKGVSYPTYKDIPGSGESSKKFSESISKKEATTLDKRGFAKASSYSDISSGKVSSDAYDKYNALELNDLKGERANIPYNITGYATDQSQDLIFFYFYDLINKIYVPFRATITSLSDQHSAEWEDISYIGRADKLFLYKGFSRDVNFSFTVYANSATEMLPMWNRINYLVGLTRPGKYTGKATVTNTAATGDTSGKESRFIYPPMVTLRLGDLFYDQPCVVSNVGVNIPDDTNWETLRSEDYSYVASPTKTININGVKSRQLPMKVDVSVQLKLMEKRQALGSNAHYGNASYGTGGTETGRWLL
jgi:hypothetical protein